MPSKRKTAEQPLDSAAAEGEIDTLTGPPAANAEMPIFEPAAAAARQEQSAGQESAPPPGAEGTDRAPREPEEEPQKSWVKRASIIVDPEAGVKFHFDYEKHQGIITFDDRPTAEQLAVARPLLNESGFEWDRVNKDGWKKKIPFLQREDDRREAKKTFYAVANALRKQKGLPIRSFGEAIAF